MFEWGIWNYSPFLLLLLPRWEFRLCLLYPLSKNMTQIICLGVEMCLIWNLRLALFLFCRLLSRQPMTVQKTVTGCLQKEGKVQKVILQKLDVYKGTSILTDDWVERRNVVAKVHQSTFLKMYFFKEARGMIRGFWNTLKLNRCRCNNTLLNLMVELPNKSKTIKNLYLQNIKLK